MMLRNICWVCGSVCSGRPGTVRPCVFEELVEEIIDLLAVGGSCTLTSCFAVSDGSSTSMGFTALSTTKSP